MDERRIAGELVRIAKEMIAAERIAGLDGDVRKEIGKAFTVLAKLDDRLSDSFVAKPGGEPSERDKAIKAIRAVIKKAIDALSSSNYLGELKKLR